MVTMTKSRFSKRNKFDFRYINSFAYKKYTLSKNKRHNEMEGNLHNS